MVRQLVLIATLFISVFGMNGPANPLYPKTDGQQLSFVNNYTESLGNDPIPTEAMELMQHRKISQDESCWDRAVSYVFSVKLGEKPENTVVFDKGSVEINNYRH